MADASDTRTIYYFLTPVSPWTHFGHARIRRIAERAGAALLPKPVDFGRVFAVSGGLPLGQRAPQRQAYRLQELARWRSFLGIPIHIHPQFFPADATLAMRAIVAAAPAGTAAQLDLAGALLKGCWEEQRNVADPATVAALAEACGLDGAALLQAAAAPDAQAACDTCTQEAIDRQVFGAPTYVIGDQLFWGQDRLDFVARHLGVSAD
jgi:2-hydroxychromene-2-carboxylate isomerase